MKRNRLLCMWTNQCENSHMCCSTCNKKNCVWRCTDNPKNCIYISTNPSEEVDIPISVTRENKTKEHNVRVDSSISKKLIRYKKSNHLTAKDIADKIDVPHQVMCKIISSSSVSVRSGTYNKIKEFVKNCSVTEKKKLW